MALAIGKALVTAVVFMLAIIFLVAVIGRLIESRVNSFWGKLGLWNEGILRLALYVTILITAAVLVDVVLYVVRFGWLNTLAWRKMAKTVPLTVLMMLFAWAAAVVVKQFIARSHENIKKGQREKEAKQLKRNS